MAITQKFDLEGGLRSADAAANAKLASMDEDARQRAAQDAKLRELIKGREMSQSAIDANIRRSQEEAKRMGLQPGKYSTSVSEGGFSVNPENASLADQLAKGLRTANITGFDVADPQNVMPSRQDAEAVKKSAQIVKQAQGELPGTRAALKASGPLDRFGAMQLGPVSVGTEAGRGLEQRKASLLSYAQRLADTGVLQPGELPLLNKRVGELTGIGSMLRSPEDIQKQLDRLELDLINKTKSEATARGYTPKEGYLSPTGTAPTKPGVPSFEEWRRMKAGK